MHADAEQGLESQSEELVRLRIQRQIVCLVGDANDRLVDVSQSSRDFLVQGQEPRSAIDHEQHHVGLAQTDLDLGFDMLGQIVDVVDSEPPGINQVELMPLVLNRMDFGVGEAKNPVNPLSIDEEIPVSFRAVLPTDGP